MPDCRGFARNIFGNDLSLASRPAEIPAPRPGKYLRPSESPDRFFDFQRVDGSILNDEQVDFFFVFVAVAKGVCIFDTV